MGRSRFGWALSVASPWCVAFAVLVSITAEAGQEPTELTSAFARSQLISAPARIGLAGRPLRAVDEDGAPLPIVQARYAVGDPDEAAANEDEIQPNGTLKPRGRAFPAVDRAAKGDPLAGAPGAGAKRFNAKRRDGGRSAAEPYAAASWPRELEDPRDDEFDPGHTMSPPRPSASEDAELASTPFGDGATPAAPLEFALNSASPTSSDGIVVLVETDDSGVTTAPQISDADGKPNYAALIDPKDSARQMRCLAEAIYFESRSEPEEGQAAVAQVVLNRVRSGIYPTTVCGVVYQDRNRPFACQFTFACEGKSLRVEEPGPWAVATRIARDVVSGANYNPKVDTAVNYHANYVAPFWAGYLRRVDRIGAHIFYAMRDGVNWAPGALNGRGDRPPVAN
jgi:hypothetical protein